MNNEPPYQTGLKSWGEPVDEPILLELANRGGCATWGELIKARPPDDIPKNTLKEAIRRLTKKGLIIARAELKDGKAVTKYCLTYRLPGVYSEGRTEPLLEYLKEMITKLAAARRKDLKAMKLSSQDIEEWSGRYPDETGLLSEAAPIMCEALGESLQALDVLILDLIMRSWLADNEEEAMRELDAGCKLVVAALIKEIAKMAHPKYADVDAAVHCAKVRLGRAYDSYEKDG